MFLLETFQQQEYRTCHFIELNAFRYRSIVSKAQTMSFNASLNVFLCDGNADCIIANYESLAEVNVDPQITRQRFFLALSSERRCSRRSEKRQLTITKPKTFPTLTGRKFLPSCFNTVAFQHYTAAGRLWKICCRDVREHAARRLHKTINNAELDAGKIENACCAWSCAFEEEGTRDKIRNRADFGS